MTFRRSDLARAIRCAREQGVDIGGVEITKAGTIRILTAAAVLPVDDEEAELAAYRAKRDGGGQP